GWVPVLGGWVLGGALVAGAAAAGAPGRRGPAQPAESLVLGLLVEPGLGDQRLEALPDPAESAVEQPLARLHHRGREAALGGDLGDTRAHEPAADDTDAFHAHAGTLLRHPPCVPAGQVNQ